MPRMMVDCRTQPSESNCSLVIAGTADEVVRAATQHVVDVHGHENTEELRSMIKDSLTEAPDGPAKVGSFVQLVDFSTDHALEEGDALRAKWLTELGDARPTGWGLVGADRDQPGRYVTIISFASYEEAMKNSEHPATQAMSAEMAKLASAPPAFRNLDVVRSEGVGSTT